MINKKQQIEIQGMNKIHYGYVVAQQDANNQWIKTACGVFNKHARNKSEQNYTQEINKITCKKCLRAVKV